MNHNNEFIHLHQEMDKRIHEKLFGKSKMMQEKGNMMEGKMKPLTSEDKLLSKRHLEQSIAFNMSHMQDHIESAQKSQRLLNTPRYFNRK